MLYGCCCVLMCVCTHVSRTVIKPTPHSELGWYMEVFALVDIPAFDELFARYGENYWTASKTDPPVEDPVKLSHDEFLGKRVAYFEALSEKYKHLHAA